MRGETTRDLLGGGVVARHVMDDHDTPVAGALHGAGVVRLDLVTVPRGDRDGPCFHPVAGHGCPLVAVDPAGRQRPRSSPPASLPGTTDARQPRARSAAQASVTLAPVKRGYRRWLDAARRSAKSAVRRSRSC